MYSFWRYEFLYRYIFLLLLLLHECEHTFWGQSVRKCTYWMCSYWGCHHHHHLIDVRSVQCEQVWVRARARVAVVAIHECVRVSTSRTYEYTYSPKTLFIHYWTINYIVGGAPRRKRKKMWSDEREKKKTKLNKYSTSRCLFLWLFETFQCSWIALFAQTQTKKYEGNEKSYKRNPFETQFGASMSEHIMENYLEWWLVKKTCSMENLWKLWEIGVAHLYGIACLIHLEIMKEWGTKYRHQQLLFLFYECFK